MKTNDSQNRYRGCRSLQRTLVVCLVFPLLLLLGCSTFHHARLAGPVGYVGPEDQFVEDYATVGDVVRVTTTSGQQIRGVIESFEESTLIFALNEDFEYEQQEIAYADIQLVEIAHKSYFGKSAPWFFGGMAAGGMLIVMVLSRQYGTY